jgi:ankyrin repeat protein
MPESWRYFFSECFTTYYTSPLTLVAASPLTLVVDKVPPPAKESLIRSFKEHGYDLDEKWSPILCGSPLQYCCSEAGKDIDKKKAAFLLLKLGANPSLPKKPWRSNLKRAIEGNAQDLFEELLRHPMTNLGDQDRQGQTLLHSLVYTASVELISKVTNVILDVDLNIQDWNGYTPLHLATLTERPEVVRKLLTVPGVRLDVADKQGRTPFTLATYWGLRVMALELIKHSQAFPVPEAKELSGLVCAAIQQDKDLCTRLLETSNYRNLEYHMDLSGKCILHHAAINDWDDVLDSCLRLGKSSIEINQMDHSGRSAIHYAATLGNVDSCLVLVRHGANLTLQDRNGRTPAQAAADAGFRDVLMVLLKSGRVNPNQYDLQGRNLVHWAATLDCVDVMERVVNAPGVGVVELERHDKNSKMPIDIAFQCKCRNVGQFLADKMRSTSGYFNIYDWDNMYCSPNVTDGDRPKKPDTKVPDWLRKKWDEEEEERRRYPGKLWSLVIYPR